MMNLFQQLFGPPVPSISAAEVHELIEGKDHLLILDVRQPHEYQSGHITGAKLIPLGDLPQRMKRLPKNRPIIAVCRSGGRSRRATRMLMDAGYAVENLQGGMMAWQTARLPVQKEKSE